MILFKPILINDLYIIVYHSRHKLTKEGLKTKGMLAESGSGGAVSDENHSSSVESF